MELFDVVLVNNENIQLVADALKKMFEGKVVTAKVIPVTGENYVLEDIRLTETGVKVFSPPARGRTNSYQLTLMFGRYAFAFETCDDFVVQRTGDSSVMITNKRVQRVDNPLEVVMFSESVAA